MLANFAAILAIIATFSFGPCYGYRCYKGYYIPSLEYNNTKAISCPQVVIQCMIAERPLEVEGYHGLYEGYEMKCSDRPNGEVGEDGCTGIFNCVSYCDGDLCNLISGVPGLKKANFMIAFSFVLLGVLSIV